MYSVFKFDGISFVIPERYKNLEVYGIGLQGIVMKAYDSETEKNVAIKKLTRAFDDPNSAKRTYREFVILTLINHKNVIKLHHTFTPQNTIEDFSDIYLVMELVDENLSQLISKISTLKDYKLDHETLSFIMYQMLCAVNHLHKSGIIHRDLSPSNIGINKDLSLKILDFGHACSANSTKLTAYVMTRHYRAPEVVLSAATENSSCPKSNYKANADVWSLGCIFAELISGQVLFPGTDNLDQWKKIIGYIGTPHYNFVRTLPMTIKNWVSKLPHCPPKSLESLLPDSCFIPCEKYPELTGDCARELISKMLVIDPTKRISVREALNHSYVKLWFDNDEINGDPSPPYDSSIDHLVHDVQTWKRLIFDQIKEWQK